ncbi:MAG TPA: PAS domain-containing protein [Ktedonobacteraceae bacterium]|nr:PAS domain-containing protein [Ktedonobacteraceae bacterium]
MFETLRILVDTMPQLVWIGRTDGSVEYFNQRWRDYTQLPFEQARGDEWHQCLHPDDQQKAQEAWLHAIQTDTLYEVELRLRNGSTGTYHWFLARGVSYKDAQGTIIRWIGTLTDIDDQKRAEQTLKASEERLRVLAETVPQFVWATSSNASLEYWNQRMSDYVQAPPEALRGYGWRQFLHPDDYEPVTTIRARSIETGEPYEMEYRLKEGRTGTYRWFLARGAPVRDETGQIVTWFGTCTDIDDQKRTEESLRRSQERVQALMDSAIIGIVVVDGETLVEANDAFLQMTGYSREEVQNGLLSLATIAPPECAPQDLQAREELAVSQQVKPYETACVCKDGSRLPVLVGLVALPHHPYQTIGFLLDNSARNELERRKDDFLSMASHELKTPLTSLKLQIQLLAKQLGRQESFDTPSTLSRIEIQVRRLERLIEELLDVSKIQAGRLEYVQETVNLDELIRDVAKTMQQTNATHTVIIHGTAPTALQGDQDRLGQVFTNLLSNAIKYSPDADTVEIVIVTAIETVTVSVRDQGIGIPRELREKIFERFYRAVAQSQKVFPGLGMGLYIVAQIVKQHGGTITVESATGKGSTFHVTLPLQR